MAASTVLGIVVAASMGFVVPSSTAAAVKSTAASMVVGSTEVGSREQLLVAEGPWFWPENRAPSDHRGSTRRTTQYR